MKYVQPELSTTSTSCVGPRFLSGLSVFFPAFNDAPALPSLIARTIETLQLRVEDFEVIVVNDGSADGTAAVLEQLKVQYHPYLRVVTHAQNQGYGAALRSGFAAATKEFVFYTDGDGQYDPGELELLLDQVTPETDWVNGYKMERHDPQHRIVIGKTYNWLVRKIFGISLRDIDCDFRLIRRSKLNLANLHSTGGTICVEIAHTLENAGCKAVELPVHHYSRQHGKSQFFRVRSLTNTFVQLCGLYFGLVLAPALSRPTPWGIAFMATCLGALSFLTYARSISLPFISDDYLQIHLGREFGPVSGWSALLSDALYRCRATSLFLTYWTERAFGLQPIAFSLSNLSLHILNSCLVLAMGYWRPIGWKVATIASCYFAVNQRHSEAVVWYAASPELLVFLFTILGFLCWIWFLQESKHRIPAYLGAFVFFGLALLSKESAVAMVPLLVLATVLDPAPQKRQAALALTPFALLAGVYFYLAFAARDTHLHFNDGTFSLSAPFWIVVARSATNLMWVWGFAALAILAFTKASQSLRLLYFSATWIVIALLPYSFLTYMTRVPSRHTYLAGMGIALIVAAGILALRNWSRDHNKAWLVPVAASVIVMHQAGYVWAVKHRQYALRAEPTEELVRVGRKSPGVIYAKCFPYPEAIAQHALQISSTNAVLVMGQEAAMHPDAINFCNAVVHE